MPAGGPRVQRLLDRAASADSLGGVIFQAIGAVIFAVGGAVASGVFALADVVIVPLNALTGGVGTLIDSVFGGSALVIDFGALASAVSLGPEGLFASPLSLPIAVGVILLSLWLVRAYVSDEPTSNIFPGLPFDPPTPGLIGPEEDDKD